MSDTRERLSELAKQQLGMDREPNFDVKFTDSGVSSVDAIAFFKEVNQAFGKNLTVGDCASVHTLGELADLLDK